MQGKADLILPNFTVPPILKRRWVQHLLFWAIYLITTMVSDSNTWLQYPDHYPLLFLATNLYTLPFTYALTLWIIPRWLYRGKWLLFIVLSLCLVVAACFIMYYSAMPVLNLMYAVHPEVGDATQLSVIDFFSTNVLFLFVVLGVKVAKDTWLAEMQRQEREQLLLAEEVSVLRAQISPHFLLNSLNTVYGISLTEPHTVPETVLRLSELLRFTLYEAHAASIPIPRELGFVQDFIALQSMRASDKLQLQVQLPEAAASTAQIAPLLLLVFLENAFKYVGPNAAQERFLHIDIALSEANVLTCCMRNSYVPAMAPTSTGGVGLRNVRRRLDLIYPHAHSLHIDDAHGVYSVTLNLMLQP
jgi:hypothetical protein